MADAKNNAVEYDWDVLNGEVLPKLNKILRSYPAPSGELTMTSKGASVARIAECFKLYQEIHTSLTETVSNIRETVSKVVESGQNL